MLMDRTTIMQAVGPTASDLADSVDAEEQARRDALTGVLNRRGFERARERIASRGGRLRLLLCDLDHFKTINDYRGHAAGDRCLCELASAMESAEPQPLAVARLGGDEFAAVLDFDEPWKAQAWMRQVCERLVERLGGDFAGEITLSGGSAAAEASEMVESWGGLYERTDAALYEAKAAGRDRLVTAE
jgi:diguanylate cyclase (GGDEF)-like protein